MGRPSPPDSKLTYIPLKNQKADEYKCIYASVTGREREGREILARTRRIHVQKMVARGGNCPPGFCKLYIWAFSIYSKSGDSFGARTLIWGQPIHAY